uniref:RRM domain-containing protein n=1 Tax=Globodera rostochiensis TaxID=31243 RepID=A0A914HIJ4_GLORO
MDLLQLPSISDDELDYELDVPGDGTNVTFNKEAEGGSSTTKTTSSKKVLFVDASKNRKRRSEECTWSPSPEGREDSETEWESCGDGDESSEFGGRLAGRVKRLASQTDEDAEQNIAAERFARILDGGRSDVTRRKLSDAELEELYTSLDADPDDASLRFNALFVHWPSVENMNTFEVSRIFAEFNPQTVRSLEGIVRSSAFVVTFENPFDVAQLLIDNSKPLRRVRTARKPEEGELVESEDEEEGQVKEEDGDDVAVVKDAITKPKQSSKDVVEVNVLMVKIPPGKWRVVVKHVPDNKLALVRIATGLQIRAAVVSSRNNTLKPPGGEIDDASNFKNTKIRPGLNVFDAKGNELDWDYEHDTRFFESGKWTEDDGAVVGEEGGGGSASARPKAADASAPAKAIEARVEGMKIRSRGRGTKKFLQVLENSDDECLFG